MTSWDSLPFEIKSLILKHYIRKLLLSAPCFTSRIESHQIYGYGRRVKRRTRNLLSVAAEMRAEIIRLAEEAKEDVIKLLGDEDVRLQQAYQDMETGSDISWIDHIMSTAIRKRELRNEVQYLIAMVKQGAGLCLSENLERILYPHDQL